MNKQDRARIFNNVMPILNHIWAESMTGIPVNLSRIGPDLIGKKCAVELKFTLVNGNNSTHPKAWTVEESQFQYDQPNRPCFWGFATYEFKRTPSSLSRFSPNLLRRYVGRREIYIAPPGWVKENYEGSLTKGISRTGSWSRILYYPKFKDLEENIRTVYFNNLGSIYLLNGVPEEFFPNLSKKLIS